MVYRPFEGLYRIRHEPDDVVHHAKKPFFTSLTRLHQFYTTLQLQVRGVKILLPMYDPAHVKSDEDADALARKFFRLFDAQGSDGISRAELPPASGESVE